MPIPRATYRLQFNEHFRLVDALALVPYLSDLGVSHIYASPLFKAVPHSLHGYDVCDFTKLNPELGTEADLERLVSALHAWKMGLILDIVPNHMGIASPENFWWWDVLKNGRASRFAGYFDIDWKSSDPKLTGKILLPVLGGKYETLLHQGEFQILKAEGGLVLGYHEHHFPLAAKTVVNLHADAPGLKKVNSDFAALDQLIRRQNYHLEFYAQGDSKLNYRRFFAVSSLAAVRVEDEKVFQATHAPVRRWLKKGWLDGLRVDHPDGLWDPEQYLRRLRALAPKAWIVVEKILEPGECLPASWPVRVWLCGLTLPPLGRAARCAVRAAGGGAKATRVDVSVSRSARRTRAVTPQRGVICRQPGWLPPQWRRATGTENDDPACKLNRPNYKVVVWACKFGHRNCKFGQRNCKLAC